MSPRRQAHQPANALLSELRQHGALQFPLARVWFAALEMREAKRRATVFPDRTHLLASPQTTLAQEQVLATELLLAMKSEQLKGLKRDWALVAGASDAGIGVDDFLFLLSRHTASIAVAARMPQSLLLAAMLDLFNEIDSLGSSSGLVEWSQFSRQLMHAAQVGDQASGGNGSGQAQEWVPSPLRMDEAAGQRGRAEGAVNVAAMAAVPGTERRACTQHAATLSLSLTYAAAAPFPHQAPSGCWCATRPAGPSPRAREVGTAWRCGASPPTRRPCRGCCRRAARRATLTMAMLTY